MFKDMLLPYSRISLALNLGKISKCSECLHQYRFTKDVLDVFQTINNQEKDSFSVLFGKKAYQC